MPAGERWVESGPASARRVDLGELWRARELVAVFALRDLRVRYKQTALGVLWAVLLPALTVGALTVAFDRVTDVPSAGLPYPVFALSGLLTWSYLSSAVVQSGESLVRQPSLLRKTAFPRLASPVAALLPPAADLAVALVLLGAVALAHGVRPGAALLLLPAWLMLLVLAALGPGLLLATANVRYRDVRHVVGPALQALLLLSPVAYSADGLDGALRWVYALNPFLAPVETGRWVLVGADAPGLPVLLSVGVGAALALAGLRVFARAAPSFADVV